MSKKILAAGLAGIITACSSGCITYPLYTYDQYQRDQDAKISKEGHRLDNGIIWFGKLNGDRKPTGYGVGKHPHWTYEGFCKEGFFEGAGVIDHKNGRKVIGFFHKDKFVGETEEEYQLALQGSND